MSHGQLLGILLLLATLAACGEWRTYALVNSVTGKEAVCTAPWGDLPDAEVQRLNQCVEACEARGFKLEAPNDVPPPVSAGKSAKPPSIPKACQT